VGYDNGQEGKEHHRESCFGEGDSGPAFEDGQASPDECPEELAEVRSCEHDQENNTPSDQLPWVNNPRCYSDYSVKEQL
jgi:hypothetical protein